MMERRKVLDIKIVFNLICTLELCIGTFKKYWFLESNMHTFHTCSDLICLGTCLSICILILFFPWVVNIIFLMKKFSITVDIQFIL